MALRDLFKRSNKHKSLSAEEYYAHGVQHMSRGKHEKAVGYFDQALSVDPALEKALNAKGATLLELNQSEKALGCYESLLDIDPRSNPGLNGKGYSLRDLGRESEALETFERMLQIDPSDAVALYNRATSLEHLGRLEEARMGLERVVSEASEFEPLDSIIADAQQRLDEIADGTRFVAHIAHETQGWITETWRIGREIPSREIYNKWCDEMGHVHAMVSGGEIQICTKETLDELRQENIIPE